MFKNLFASPFAEYNWAHDPSVTDRLREQIVNLGPIGNQSSHYFDNLPPNDDVNLVLSWLMEISKDYAHRAGRTSGFLILEHCFGRIITNQNYTIPLHFHYDAYCVGTMYLTEGNGDIVLVDPRGNIGAFEQDMQVKDMDGNSQSICTDYYHTPKKDTAIIFPGYIKHMVQNSKTDYQRVRIALSWDMRYAENLDKITALGVSKDYICQL
jgi:hypothetical protein